MIPHSEETRHGSSPSSPKPTLEQLLRVKREERPDDAFWADFERGLAHKQLAAIVEPRPWWLGLSLLGRRMGALGLPVSAAAAALLAIMVVRTESPLLVTQGTIEFGPAAAAKISTSSSIDGKVAAPLKSVAQAGSDDGALSATMVVATSEKSDAQAGAVTVRDAISDTSGPAIEAANVSVAVSESDSRVSSREMIAVSSYSAVLAGQAAPESPTASQITIAQNLAAVTAEAPELVAAVSPVVAFAEAPVVASDSSAPAGNSRQARLLAMAEMPELADADAGIAQVRERMVHRLDSDASNYAEASRLGYRADRLSLSF